MQTALAVAGRKVVLVSITPPGEAVLPWDEERCSHPHGGDHEGKRGCRVQQRAAREWSETAIVRLDMMRRSAAAHVRRHAPIAAKMLDRVWEPQKRGVPHWHGVFPADTPDELAAVAELVKKLKELAPEYGFGYVDARGKGRKDDPRSRGRRVIVRGETLKLISAEDAARYLASYLSGRSRYKPSMQETVTSPAMRALLEQGTLRRPLWWVSPTLTRVSMVTMRTLRRARHLWALLKGIAAEGPSWINAREAVQAALVVRQVFGRRTNRPPPVDPAEALRLADHIDEQGHQLVTIWDGLAEWEIEARHTAAFRLELAGLARMIAEPAVVEPPAVLAQAA